MLVDVIQYGGEADLLEARLDHMQADYTIVVEGDHTFTNEFKGWTFDEVYESLEGYHSRLVFQGVRSPKFDDPWANEAHQRNQAHNVLVDLNLPDDAVISLFDTDEFPDPELLREKSGVFGWLMAKYQMSLFWFQRKELTGVSAPWGWLRGRDLEQVRKARGLYEVVDGGFHFSSFGNVQRLLDKWRGFAHTEFWRPDMEEWILHCWENGRAIENGEWLVEETGLNPKFPDYMSNFTGGPAHWYRRRV